MLNTRRYPFPLAAWYTLSAAWLVHVLMMAGLMMFRAIKHAGVADTFDFENVPPLHYIDLNYNFLFQCTAGFGLIAILVWLSWIHYSYGISRPKLLGGQQPWTTEQRSVMTCSLFALAFTTLGLIACRYSQPENAAAFDVEPTSFLDWACVVCLAVTTWYFPYTITLYCESEFPENSPFRALPAPVSSRTIRNGMAYLLGSAALFVYAWYAHKKFWDPEANGGYIYDQFFLEEEMAQAHLVLYSTSVLFASVAAIAGCVVLHLVRRTALGKNPGAAMSPIGEARRLVFLLAGSWAVAMMVPWQIKIMPEIRAENGWIFPAVTLIFTTAALLPMMFVSLLMMMRDFENLAVNTRNKKGEEAPVFLPRRSELAMFTFVLFPVYPLLRLVRFAGAEALYVTTLLAGGAAVRGLTWVGNKADKLFTFDDWRDMMKSAQFPFMQVVFSMLAAYFVYLVGRRLLFAVASAVGKLLSPSDREKAKWFKILARPVVLLATVASLALATWPFWGWHNVNKNVFARTAEFSHRHDFELRFLHWIFDADRDGYSAVLHGADLDDFNSNILAGGTHPPVDDNPVPISHFEITDQKKAKAFPNVALLFLEGVVPRAISAYGQRGLIEKNGGLIGTPHMDAIAREGTIFTQARCHYPSTWDGWFAVCSGRYLRIKEMDTSVGFGNRYTRYNNLYKAVMKTGERRWCHADTSPFYKMLVPYSLRESEATAWKPDYTTSVSAEESERGIWRGDKRNQRMLDFIDSLKPGEKFFFCEHMSDTHFPWRKTPIEQARKLGFPDGLDPYDSDAILPNGSSDAKYSNYFQTITRMDGQIGQLVKKLKDKGLYENTMIIIVGDHGCQWWEHEHMYYVSHLYDQSLLLPIIIRFPGIPGGNSSNEPVMQTDIMATVMELAGVKLTNPSSEFPMTCKSLVPLMKGTATEVQRKAYWKRDVILTTHYDKLGVLSQFRHKLIFNRPTGTYRLFDLKEDPGETKNLVDEEPELLEKMMEKFRKLMKQHGAITGGIKISDNPKPLK